MTQTTNRRHRAAAAIMLGLSLGLGACSNAPAPTASLALSAPAPTAVTPTVLPPTPAPTAYGGIGDYTPGTTSYQVVNLTSGDINLYVRTQGQVKVYEIATGVATGTPSDTFAAPEPGTVVVVKPGVDPACVVGSCGFAAEVSTASGQGNERIVVVRDDGATELWAHPDKGSVGKFGNALRPADSSKSLLFVSAESLNGADFGLRLAYAGSKGCQPNVDKDAILIGGNVIPVFAFTPGTVKISLYDSTDADCSGTPLGGPFQINGSAGARVLLFLYGSTTDIQNMDLQLD